MTVTRAWEKWLVCWFTVKTSQLSKMSHVSHIMMEQHRNLTLYGVSVVMIKIHYTPICSLRFLYGESPSP